MVSVASQKEQREKIFQIIKDAIDSHYKDTIERSNQSDDTLHWWFQGYFAALRNMDTLLKLAEMEASINELTETLAGMVNHPTNQGNN